MELCRSCGRAIPVGDSVTNGICSRCRVPDTRGRAAFVIGAGLVVLALKLLRHTPSGALISFGAGVVAFLIGLIGRAASDHRLQQEDAADTVDRAQIAGRTCPVCDKKILSVFDGVACDTCATAVHEDCLGKHETHAHRDPKKHPYRL